ncbi:hypothetical protein RQP46_002213 [Phenoliferia psychrophenolica]
MPSDDPYAELNTYIGVGANQELATSLTAPLFCGWMLHVLLFGLVAQHAFNYRGSEAFKSEARGQRIIFGLVVGMDALASAVSFAQTMTYGTIQNRDVNTLLLGVNQPLDCLPFFLGGLVALIVQLSLAARAAKFFLGRDTLRKVFLWVVGVLAGIAWLGSVCVGFMYALFSAQPENPLVVNAFYFNIFICIWTSTSAAVDIIITVSLCQVLQSELRGWNLVTDGLLRKVIVLATETGAMTAVTAICAAILSVSFPSTNISKINICFVFAFPLPSLYALSYLYYEIEIVNASGPRPPRTTEAFVGALPSRALIFPPEILLHILNESATSTLAAKGAKERIKLLKTFSRVCHVWRDCALQIKATHLVLVWTLKRYESTRKAFEGSPGLAEEVRTFTVTFQPTRYSEEDWQIMIYEELEEHWCYLPTGKGSYDYDGDEGESDRFPGWYREVYESDDDDGRSNFQDFYCKFFGRIEQEILDSPGMEWCRERESDGMDAFFAFLPTIKNPNRLEIHEELDHWDLDEAWDELAPFLRGVESVTIAGDELSSGWKEAWMPYLSTAA